MRRLLAMMKRQFAEEAQLGQAIRENIRGLGYDE